MKPLLLAAIMLALPVAIVFVAGGGEIGDYTTTSMGPPSSSPNYSASPSAIVPGLPFQERPADRANRGHERQRQAEAGEVNLAPHSSKGTGWSRSAFQNTSSRTMRSSHRLPWPSGTLNRNPEVMIAPCAHAFC